MGKTYYCEYCDKSFKDELHKRKNHLASVQHQKLRKEHYDKYRDLATILKEELAKKPCNRNSNGECGFGSICRFSHYTRDQLFQIEQKLKYKEEQKRLKVQPKVVIADLDGFWKAREQKHIIEEANNKVFWEYPDELVQNLNLPPSMAKFDATRLKGVKFTEWG